MQIEFGNVDALDTQGTGWFLGYSEWARAGAGMQPALRYMPEAGRSHGLCMKWMTHPAGDPRGTGKPVSQGRTLSLLVGAGGRFRLQFSPTPDFPFDGTREIALARQGDFVVWGAGIHHRYYVDAACTVLTLRWIPDDSAAV